jgi:hypothetical protein
MVDNMYNRGGRVNYKKGGRGRQDRMGGTMEQTAAELRAVNPAEFGGGMKISHGGGNDGNNNPPQLTLVDKNPNIVKDTLTNAAINFGAKELGLGHLVNPAFLLKGAYDYLKNPKIKDEDVTLETSEVITDYPSDNLLAFEPGSTKDKKIKSLHKERGLTKDLGIPFPQKKENQYQELLQEDQEQTDFPKSELLTAADGGRVGMFMGGDPLTGQALSIYESMNSYGFSDAEIASALQQQGLYTPPGSGTPTPDPTPTPTPGQGGGQDGGGGGITELQKTYSTLPGDPKNFRLSQLEGTSDYFPPTTMMGKTKNFIQEKFFQPKVKGTLGTRLANQPRLPLPLSIAAYARSPFNPESATYNPNFESQLNFLEGLSGTKLSGNWKNATKFDEFGKPIEFGIIEGQSMIGRDPNSGALKYGPGSVLEGKNVISGFGSNNYETALNKYISRMLRYENPTKFQAAKLQKARDELAAYKTQQEEKDIIDQKENLANATAIQKATIAARGREGGSGGRMVDRRTGAMKGYEQGAGGGKDAASEHFYIKDGGIAQYAPKKKGIASMFTRRR